MNTGTAHILTTRGVNLPAHGLPVAPRKRRKDATKLTEREFMAQVVEFAKLHGWLVYHTHDSRRSAPGFLDLILVKARTAYAWELKVEPNKPTPDQLLWLGALNCAGINATVLYPRDWGWIQERLTA